MINSFEINKSRKNAIHKKERKETNILRNKSELEKV